MKKIMKRKMRLSVWIFWLLAVISGCQATLSGFGPSEFKLDKSLSQSELSYYNDTFDKMREDIWEKATLVYGKDQLIGFEVADIRIENGMLMIETKTRCFSRGGLISKYTLRGEFDVQVDCKFDFLGWAPGMLQLVQFVVVEKGVDYERRNGAMIQLVKRPNWYRGKIISAEVESAKYHPGNRHELDSFHGALRIIRKGEKICALYKAKGNVHWKDA
jgi:hypothetical protein